MTIIKVKEKEAKDPIERFLQSQRQNGVTENTISAHTSALRQMFPCGFTENTDYEERLNACLPKKDSDSYYNKKLNSYRMFFGMLVNEGNLPTNPALEWKYRKHTINIVKVLDKDVCQFLNGFSRDTFAGFRGYVLSVFILDTGARPTEALRLKLTDIDYKLSEVSLRAETTKNRVPRLIPCSPTVLNLIKRLVSYRPENWKEDYVFCTSDGKELGTSGLQLQFRDNGKKTGVLLSPYQLRHIFATTYIRNGGDAFALQRILGHNSLQMTQVYVNLDIQDLHDKHVKASPISNFIKKRIQKI